MSNATTLDSLVDFDKPYMFIWQESEETGESYRVLLEATYESYPDGDNIVSDPYIKGAEVDGREGILTEDDLPEDIQDLIESLFEDTGFYEDMLEFHERSLNA
jgi:hypothetical protein